MSLSLDSPSKSNPNVLKSPIKTKKSLKRRQSETSAMKKIKDEVSVSQPKPPSQSQTSSSNGGDVCVEGMTAAELTMVKRLAGNDPAIRKKTLKKLKKWLNVLAQKVPDVPDCRSMIEPNFIRVWKALFYCMWMADKPLPQEHLAEQLSDMQMIFAEKTGPFLLFVEWFIRTMSREWNWIDRFRIDKFMMLFRRFLRKSLMVLAQKKWRNEVLDGYLKIISVHIFNRVPTPKNRRQSFTSPLTVAAPLGLQIHFTDVFMEELAKVGGDSMKFPKILKVLSVFIQELGYSNDDRLLDEIRERIFVHLMRQSDVGIDYQDMLANGGLEETEEELELVGDGDDDEDVDLVQEDEDNDEVFEEDNGPLDPRAGAVDVILPQLDVDYEKLYKKLIEYGGQKDVRLKNRRILYLLASEFKELTEGKYPLALPEEDNTPAIPRKEMNAAAKRLLESETVPGEGKRRKTKKERKREAKRKLNSTLESVGSEDDSKYIHDDELLDHVTDNYMSYLENEVEAKTDENDVETNENDGTAAAAEEEEESKRKKLKKVKDPARKRKYKTIVEVEADEIDAGADTNTNPDPEPEPVQEQNEEVKKKRSKKKEESESEQVILIKKPKISKRNSLGNLKSASNDIGIGTPTLKGKSRRLTELHTPIARSSPLNRNLTASASSSKRVSFVLARNMEHEHADYPVSIARSPAIPFDKHRRPSNGLLKSPGSTTPKSTPIRRATALDFF